MIIDLSWDPTAVAYRADYTHSAHIVAGPFLRQERKSFVDFVHAVTGLLNVRRVPVRGYTLSSFSDSAHDILVGLIEAHNQSIRDS